MHLSILVKGGTSYLGGKEITYQLVQKVTMSDLERTDSTAKELAAKGATIIPGDLTKAETLLPALQRIETVISTAKVSVRR